MTSGQVISSVAPSEDAPATATLASSTLDGVYERSLAGLQFDSIDMEDGRW